MSNLFNEMMQEMSEKDQRIADLEAKLAKNKKWFASNEGFLENQKLKQQLAESDEYKELLLEEKAGYLDLISGYADKCKELEKQLAEKEKEIEYQESMKILEVKNQNQTAIAVLEDLKCNYYAYDGIEFLGYIEQQIKSLKGGEE